MKVLLIAYEYPPILAAQSLRWLYLGNELRRHGIDLHVLTPRVDLPWVDAPRPHADIHVHRAFAGPFVGLCNWMAARVLGSRTGQMVSRPAARSSGTAPGAAERFLQAGYRVSRRALNGLLYPDVRSEWYPFAWRAFRRLHARHRFDCIISSHEPCVGLLLGLRIKQRFGLPWLVDLADPLAPIYQPARWHARSKALQAQVCHEADHVLVTNAHFRAALLDQVDISENKVSVLTQGFDAGFRAEPGLKPPSKRFTVLFTGNFYAGFRDPMPLAQAMQDSALSDIKLIVAGADPRFRTLFQASAAEVEWLPLIPHGASLALQRQADVLLNLGNSQREQVPGKFFEYLGAGKPILHISMARSSLAPDDESAVLLNELACGTTCLNTAPAIRDALLGLMRTSQSTPSVVHEHSRQRYSWQALGRKLHALLLTLPRAEDDRGAQHV